MRKLLIVFLSLAIIMIFSACSEKTNKSDENNIIPESSSQEGSITPEEVKFDCFAEVPAKAEGTVSGGNGSSDLLKFYKNSEEVAADSDLVIRGKVEKAEYVLVRDYVYTKSTVVIDEVYKGNSKVGDKISVIESGGFIPNGELSNAICLEKFGVESNNKDDTTILDIRFDGYKVMEKGEKVVLFLNEIQRSDVEDFMIGCYWGTSVWQSKLLYHEEIDAYAPYIPKANKDFVEAKIYKENQLYSIVH